MSIRHFSWLRRRYILVCLWRHARTIIEMLFPESCLLCGGDLSTRPRVFRTPVCRSCFLNLDRSPQYECTSCGAPVAPEIERCLGCNNQLEVQPPNELGRVHSLLVYRNSASRLVSSWKIGSRRAATPLLVAMLGEFMCQRLRTIGDTKLPDIPIVPVPARPASRIRRGWDPPGSIVRGLERSYGAQTLRVLRRHGNGPQQKTLGRESRFANIKGAFELRRRYVNKLPPTVILFDDVLTTGATAAECARILRKHGVTEIITFVAARDI